MQENSEVQARINRQATLTPMTPDVPAVQEEPIKCLLRVDSSAILGIDAYIVRVEVDISSSVPMFTIVGLPDAAVQESRERVRSAIKNTGLEFPLRRITINLAPADIKKQGPSFDLPIAVGLLAATGQVRSERLAEGMFVGELALDGAVSPGHRHFAYGDQGPCRQAPFSSRAGG